MSRKLTTGEMKNLKALFEDHDYLLKDSQAGFILFSCLKTAAETLRCSTPEALEIILREYSDLVEDWIKQEIKQAGIPGKEIDNTVAIFMRMANPWIANNSFLSKSEKTLFPEKNEIRSEVGFGF